MTKIFKFFAERKAKKEAEIMRLNKQSQDETERRRLTMIQENKAAKDLMLNKQCAANGMQYCTDDCVHFQEGSVDEYVGFYRLDNLSPVTHLKRKPPKCKLWGNSND